MSLARSGGGGAGELDLSYSSMLVVEPDLAGGFLSSASASPDSGEGEGFSSKNGWQRLPPAY